ncbi:MAG: hypothetical protein M3Q84_03840, partial [Actinomycetota bacterium]|nr:hypothetical protein [Actinomycetota bacterium]
MPRFSHLDAQRQPGGGAIRVVLATVISGTFTFMKEVKARLRGTSRISSKHQVTIPVDALRDAGLEVGERLSAR